MNRMSTYRRTRFVIGHTVWMFATILVLTLLSAFSIKWVFISSLVGLLIVTQLTGPVHVAPRWRGQVAWLILLGLVGFAIIVFFRILAVLPSEVLP